MPDISLLPQEMRKKEDEGQKKAQGTAAPVVFHVPAANGAAPSSNNLDVKKPAKPGFFASFSSRFNAAKPPPKPAGSPMLPTVAKTSAPTVSPAPVKMSVPAVVASPPAKEGLGVVSAAPMMPKPMPVAPPPPAPKLPPPPPPKPPVVVSAPAPVSAPARPSPALHTAEAVGGNSLRVSLIPTVSGSATGRDPKKIVAAATIGALVIAALAYGGILFYVNGQRNQAQTFVDRSVAAQAKTKSLNAQLADARLAERQLKAINTLLGTHVFWTRFFLLLEKNTDQDVALGQFTTQGLDTVSIQADARSYRAVAEQVQALAAIPGMIDVHVSGLNADIGPTGQLKSVKFTLTLHFSQDLIQGAASK